MDEIPQIDTSSQRTPGTESSSFWRSHSRGLLALAPLLFGITYFFYLSIDKIKDSAALFPQNAIHCPVANTLPMYGCGSYEEFVSKRPPQQVEADKSFIEDVLEISKGDRLEAQRGLLAVGINYLRKGDLPTARKRANQVWLVDHNNYNSFWLFGLTYFEENKSEDALLALRKAISIYDEKYEYAPGDHSRLVCDLGRGLLVSAASKDAETGNKLVREAVDLMTLEINEREAEVPYHCYVHLSGATLLLGDRSKATFYLREAIAREPSLRKDDQVQARIRILGGDSETF